MITIPAGARILLATQPIDFRKGAHGLAALAQEVLGENPFSGTVIVYRSKRSDRVKILVWEAWFRSCRFRVTRARGNRRPVRVGYQLESCPAREAVSLPRSRLLGL